jgi:AraC-like DNA-binding protein
MTVELDPWPARDPLSEALYSLRMNGAFYCRSELTAPWGMSLPVMPGYMWFHVVVSGSCWLAAGAEVEPQVVGPGDFVLVPHGEGHAIFSGAGVPTPSVLTLPLERVSDRYELLRYGGNREPTILICGAVRFDHPAAQDLIHLLPRIIKVEACASQQDWMQSTLQLMAAEAITLRPGGETVVTRLSDVLVIQAIRIWLESSPAAQQGWLGALRDKQIGKAIALIHREPGRPWTLATLAGEIAVSRSAFAARFAEVAGQSPMQYLTRWRMHLARGWLMEQDMTVSEVAEQLGYTSEAAFSRAFKRVNGTPPGALRRERSNAKSIAGVRGSGRVA